MAEKKDKNGVVISEGDKVKFFSAEFYISRFQTSMKGISACGVYGCFPIKEIEKVDSNKEN